MTRSNLEIDGRTVAVEIRHERDSIQVRIDDREIESRLSWIGRGAALVEIGGRSHDVGITQVSRDRVEIHVGGRTFLIDYPTSGLVANEARRTRRSAGAIEAPMPGKVVAVLVSEGEDVEEEQCLLVVEAMKMENEIRAPFAGCVRSIHVDAGQIVEVGDALVEIG